MESVACTIRSSFEKDRSLAATATATDQLRCANRAPLFYRSNKKEDKKLSYRVPFVDPREHYRRIKSEIDFAITDTLTKGDLVLRQQLRDFERNLAEFVGVKYAVGLNSCYHALHFSLLAAGVGPGDEVVTVGHTFVATVSAIVHTGAKPVLVDVREDYNMAPDKLAAAITSKTKAVIPVHLNGRCAIWIRSALWQGLTASPSLRMRRKPLARRSAARERDLSGSRDVSVFTRSSPWGVWETAAQLPPTTLKLRDLRRCYDSTAKTGRLASFTTMATRHYWTMFRQPFST